MSRVRKAVTDPTRIRRWLERNSRRLLSQVRHGEFAGAMDVLGGMILGWDRYISLLMSRNETVVRTVQGSKMVLVPDSGGVSRDLLIHGVREPHTTAAFTSALRDLRDDVDGTVTAFDIGANIGYFALLQARHLGPNARIFACEPGPQNRALLQRSIELNGYGDRLTVDEVAISDSDGDADLMISGRPNLHRLVEYEEGSRKQDRPDDGGTITVPTRTIESYLQEKGVDPGDLNVLRMDVEGHEGVILGSSQDLLAGDQPFLCNIEFHPDLVDAETRAEILGALDRSGFEIVSVYHDGAPADIDSFAELRDRMQNNCELVARRR